MPLWQSPSPMQALPGAQAKQLPPQSTSDSEPFCTPSAQVAARHTPDMQVLLLQSASLVQRAWFAQGGQSEPPQSVSVSLPFTTVSSHAEAVQRPAEQ
jgi:hypothetical protein